MRKIVLYIAASLDGKIAGPDGNVDWLEKIPNPDQADYGYQDFFSSVDTTIMGHSTYRQVLKLSKKFPYSRKKNYVLTGNTEMESGKYVQFITGDVLRMIKTLKKNPGKNIWLIGGGVTNTYFRNHGLIDEIRLFVMPIILGEGIPLFAGRVDPGNLYLKASHSYASGVTELNYTIEKP